MNYISTVHFHVAMLLTLFCLHAPQAPAAQVIALDAPRNSASDSPRTMTLVYEAANAQLTIVVVTGGEGRLRFTESTTGTRQDTVVMLLNLRRADFSKVRANLVVFDSPYDVGTFSDRRSADHLDRIESVIALYKDKFNVPVWLFGHSNGSLSITEFINKPERRALVAGLITSGSRNEINISTGVNLPILFVHYERDGCRSTQYSSAQRNFDQAKSRNQSVTALATITGGEERGDPCRDGRHMYFSAHEEAAKAVGQFLSDNYAASGNR